MISINSRFSVESLSGKKHAIAHEVALMKQIANNPKQAKQASSVSTHWHSSEQIRQGNNTDNWTWKLGKNQMIINSKQGFM